MERMMLMRLRRLNRSVALLVGLMLLLCAAVVLLDIILRQVGSSLGGTDEISGYAMAIATSWGMAYTLLELGHVRIDLLRTRAPAFGRAMFDLFSMVVMTGVVVLIAIKCWPVVARSWTQGSTANTPLETPLIWVQAPWFAGWLWFAGMSAVVTLLAASLIFRRDFEGSEEAIGAFAEQDTLQ
ncbi:TRAP transporter small permease subunit [Pontivivens insulae]|uniref:TRAP transporter small permease protein n=1 Tax=Pontivivens insulae TaxID=1639689 RepID=A0A2R8ACS3_9RHOB|nr:TRAP transporter small permease [Pontivivens insulae]RED13979.1 TRAP-type C4-dicarboxylate transport system permease small subunit [Pontivivens insulae]SPF30053.1 hypothetical protein POI8812_02383 [Pontivivens insulae]